MIRSLTGDELPDDSPLKYLYRVVKDAGLLRGKQGQDLVAHPPTNYFAVGYGINPSMVLS